MGLHPRHHLTSEVKWESVCRGPPPRAMEKQRVLHTGKEEHLRSARRLTGSISQEGSVWVGGSNESVTTPRKSTGVPTLNTDKAREGSDPIFSFTPTSCKGYIKVHECYHLKEIDFSG